MTTDSNTRAYRCEQQGPDRGESTPHTPRGIL
jgi:hypothetical protein